VARVKIVRAGRGSDVLLEGHRSMNRISIRGVGIAATALAATSLAFGATPAAAHQNSTVNANMTISDITPISVQTTPNTASRRAMIDGDFDGHQSKVASQVAVVHTRAVRRVAAVKVAKARQAAAAAAAAARAQALADAKAVAARRAAAAQAASRSQVRAVAISGGSAWANRALGQQIASAAGWGGDQFACLDNIWSRESGWRTNAYNPNGGAYGIPQAQPGGKMAGAGADWQTNPGTQIRWGLAYIARAYGSPCSAWTFWQAHRWY
jgi:hypothetical protein